MRFLIDVNASGIVTRWLLGQGHDAIAVVDTNPRMSDEAILAWALAEERIVVTTDQDFEELIWREGKRHHGLLRLENLPRIERIALLDYVLAHYHAELEAGAIVIAASTKIRIRRRHT